MSEKIDAQEWNFSTLEVYLSNKIQSVKEYASTNFQQVKERTDMALAASEKAVTKAEVATEKRFDAVNEFRGAMDDQAKNMVSRAEYTVQQNAMSEKISDLSQTVTYISSHMAGKTEGIGGVGVIIVGIMVVLNTLASISAVVVAFLS